MKKSIVKMVALLTSLLMLISLAVGCAGNGSKPDSTGNGTTAAATTAEKTGEQTADPNAGKKDWEIDNDKKVELSVYIGHSVWTGMLDDWGKDEFTKRVEQDTGVTINPVHAPDSQHTKLNMMIASGEFSDIMLIPFPGSLPTSKKLAEEDKIWDLKELAAQYAPNFMNVVPQNVKSRIQLEYLNKDKFYQMPFYYIPDTKMTEPEVIQSMVVPVVMKDIYEAIGSPVIKNETDWLNMLRTVKQKYPEITPLLIVRTPEGPIDLVWNRIAPYAGIELCYQDGDTWRFNLTNPKMLDCVKIANTLYNEKLVHSSFLTDRAEQAKTKLWSGKVFSELYEDADNITSHTTEILKNRPDSQLIAIEPFSIAGGTPSFAGLGDGSGIGWGYVISKSTKYPEKCIRFLEYMNTEEAQRALQFGWNEGETYTMVNGKPVIKDEYAVASPKYDKELVEKMGINKATIFRDDYWARVQRYPFYDENVRKAFELGNKYAANWSKFDGVFGFPADSEETKAWAKIVDYSTTEYAKMITGKPEKVESTWNTYIETIKGMGMDKLDAFANKIINDRQKLIETYK